VEAGGQAIVGNVEAGQSTQRRKARRDSKQRAAGAAAITHGPGETIDLETLEPQQIKRRER
jgi:hypothetical protein